MDLRCQRLRPKYLGIFGINNYKLDFKLTADFNPTGDQPQAINELIEGINKKEKDQVLMGVTRSGKTFTMAHVIKTLNKPTLIMAPNKTLAAQLYGEMKEFFPENAVEYFVSYYDYYHCLLYTSPSPRDTLLSRMPSSA